MDPKLLPEAKELIEERAQGAELPEEEISVISLPWAPTKKTN